MALKIFYGYLCIGLVMAARLAWFLWQDMDKYDWIHRKLDLVMTAFVASLLWPATLLRPSVIWNPVSLFESEFDLSANMAERARREAHLRQNPPPCGDVIRYTATGSLDEENFGVFTFDNHELRECLAMNIRDNPHLENNHEGEVLHWLKASYDAEITEPVDVPELWYRFEYTADELVREGRAGIYCKKCSKKFVVNELKTNDDKGKPSWNYRRLSCPEGHALLWVRWLHVYPG